MKSFPDRYLYNIHKKSGLPCGTIKPIPTRTPLRQRKTKTPKNTGEAVESEGEPVEYQEPSVSNVEEEAVEQAEVEMDDEGGLLTYKCILPGGDVVNLIGGSALTDAIAAAHFNMTSRDTERDSHSSGDLEVECTAADSDPEWDTEVSVNT